MKIEKITLSQQKLVEIEGEYDTVESEAEKVPCVITNRALKIAREQGEIRTSLITDLTRVSEGEDLEDERILQAIYVGYVGGQILMGNKMPKYSFDEFTERYNDSTTEKGILYSKLLTAEKENNFANGVEKNTKKTVGKGEKK